MRMGASRIAPVFSVLMRLSHWFIDGAAAAHTACLLLRFDWPCSNRAPVRWTPPTGTDMLDQPSKDTEKSAPGWRFLKLLEYGDAPSVGPGKGKTKSRTPKELEERKHQFAVWYIFAAFLGVMLVQFRWPI
jgi:hypothetical protein